MKENNDMNNIDLNTITVAEAKALNITGMDMYTVVKNPINQAQLKKNEEFAAKLPQKVVSAKRSTLRNLDDIKEGVIEEVEQYSTVKLNSTILNAFIRWNEKTSNNNQVWIKPDVVPAFKQANPDVVVTDFDPKAVSAGATQPYIGGGFVKSASKSEFIQMVNNITA